MTSIRPVTSSPAPAGGQVAPVPASCRVTLLVADSHQIDLVLPAAVPVSALADSARDTVNRILRSQGSDELDSGVYRFARAVGMTSLAADLSLSAQGVTDGELLALVPDAAVQRYSPLIENVSTALARWAKDHFPPVSAADAVTLAAALTGVALAVAAVIVWRLRWSGTIPPVASLPSTGGPWWVASAVFAGVALLMIVGVVLATRLGAGRVVVGGAGWAGLAAAVLAGASAPYGTRPGAPHAFLAALVALIGALMLARVTRRHWSAAAAVITVSAAALAAAGVRMFFAVPGQRIGIVALVAVLVAARVAPGVGLRMAKVPRQSFGSITGRDMFARAPGQPEDTISPVESAPHDITLRGEQVAEVSLRSNRVLSGMLLGVAVVQVVASVVAIDPGATSQWPSVTVVVVVGLVLILRARAMRHRRHAITIVCGSALSLIAVPAHYGLASTMVGATAGGTTAALVAAAAVLGVAGVGFLAATAIPAHVFSEPVRQIVEFAEYLGYVLIIPFAAWAIGLLHYVRYH